MKLEISKLPPWAKVELSKESLVAFAHLLITANGVKKKDTSDEEEILTIEEASTFIKLAKQTCYQLCSKKAIPHYKRNKRLYFKKSELLKWLEEGKQEVQEEDDNEVRAYLHRKQKEGRR